MKLRRGLGRSAFLFADGLIATAAGFGLIDATFLYCEGYLQLWIVGLGYAATVAWIVGADRLYRRLELISPAGWRRGVPTLYALCFFAGGVALPRWFAYRMPRKGYSNLWYTMDWHRFPLNILLCLRTDPWLSLGVVLGFVAATQWAVMRRRWLRAALGFAVCFLAYAYYCIRVVDARDEWLVQFALPILAIPITLIAHRAVLSTRVTTATALFLLAGMNYVGVVPVANWGGPRAAVQAGVERIYPRDGAPAEFPQMFYRSIVLDAEDRWTVLSYGPTSGLVRIAGGALQERVVIHGMIRHLFERPGTGDIYGINMQYQDLVIAHANPLAIRERIDLESRGLSANVLASQFDWQHDGFYVAEYDNGLVSEYRLSDVTRKRSLSFFDQGLSRFRSGVYQLALDPERRRLYVAFGITDVSQNYGIAAIDLDRWEIVWHLTAPFGGLGFALVSSGGRLVSSDFFGRRALEVDTERGTITREIPAPLSTRGIAYDEERRVFYLLGFADGILSAVDDASGTPLWTLKVGPKAAALAWAPRFQALYTASGWGLHRVDVCAVENSGRTPSASCAARGQDAGR